MPEKIKFQSYLISGEATGRFAIKALVAIVAIVCGAAAVFAIWLGFSPLPEWMILFLDRVPGWLSAMRATLSSIIASTASRQ